MARNNKQCLLMFTDFYPFTVGEEFLEQEIGYTASCFDQVHVIPIRQKYGAKLTRPLPENVTAHLVSTSSYDHWFKQITKKLLDIYLGKNRFLSTKIWQGRLHLIDLKFAANCYEMYRRIVPLIQTLNLKQYDRVVVYSYWFFTGVAIARMLKDNGFFPEQTKIVSRAHAYDVDEADNVHNFIPARRFLSESADVVFPISEYANSFLRKYQTPNTAKLKIARLGVPVSPYQETRSIPMANEKWHFVSCSHMAPYKRVDLLIDALEILVKRTDNFIWTHIGEFVPERLEAMKEKALQQLPHNCFNFIGHLSNQEVQEYYLNNQAHLFINVSSGEGVPVSIMEAQAASLPVLATNAGGTKEIVLDGKNGWIIPLQSTAQEIAQKLESIMKLSDSKYRDLSKSAWDGWNQRSNSKKQYEAMAHFLSQDIWEQ